MDDTFQQLLALAGKGTVEQRCATLVVMGALHLTSADALKTAGAMLQQANPVLKDYALRYLEEVKARAAVSLVVDLLEDPDRDIQERAIRWLSGAGQPAVQPLVRRAASASRPWQINAARVLAAVRGKAAFKGLLDMLLTGTDEFNKAICDLLTPVLREMDSGEQEALYGDIEAFATALDPKQQRPAMVSTLRLLGQLGRPQARRWIVKFIGPEWPPLVRSHALVALLQCVKRQELRKDEFTKLLGILEETEFSEAVRLALELLDAHETVEEHRTTLTRLMQSPHVDVQKFALRKLGDSGTPAAVRTLVQQLGDADFRRRDVAARSLRKIPEARGTLLKELLACEDPSKAWSISELLVSWEAKWRQETLEALWKRLQAAVEEDERIQTAFLHVLKKADAAFVYRRLSEHGIRLLRTRKYKDAVAFLTLLKDFSDFQPQEKFVLALAQLKAHAHTVASQRQHPALELVSELYRNSTYPVFEALKKEKSFAPEELFALGFTLAERSGDERSLGRDLLEHLASKFPRHKIGKSAKNKLRLRVET
jgi:HEAT repeat protein